MCPITLLLKIWRLLIALLCIDSISCLGKNLRSRSNSIRELPADSVKLVFALLLLHMQQV